jgi:type I restriction enzyme S subunit
MTAWATLEFSKTIRKTKIGRKNQVLSSDIKPSGRFPVVDQGQAFIAGYSDEEDRLIRDDLPLVVFGDHTRCVKYVDFPFIVGADGTKVLKPNAELFDPKFFYYALLSLNIPNRGYNRHFTLLKEKTLPRPERAEQRKIAAVLGLVQRAIEQQERLIALTTELKKALLHKLFTEGLRDEPQKQTEIGPVPESWEVVMLEDAAVAFDYGTSVKCEHGNAGVPVLRIPNVVRGSIDLSDLKHGQPKRSELEQVRLRDGDLLFVRTNGVLENAGRCALYRGELEGCYFASYLIRVRVDSTKVLPAFVNEYARSERGRSFLSGRAIRTADGKFNINSGTLKRVLLPLPGLDEQKEIVRQLDLVERKLKLHESKRSALSELFRTLLHQLMTAEFRVQDLNLPELKAAKRQ